MKLILRWLAVFVGVVAMMAVVFSFYARFLVDFSLESLQVAGRVADRSQAFSSQSSLHVYRNLMQTLMFEEASRQNLDFKNLALLEMASRSAGEQGQGDFQSRYKFYLSEVSKAKTSQRSVTLRILDSLSGSFARMGESLQSIKTYLQRRAGAVSKVQVRDLTSAVLLSQAETSEKKNDFERAVSLYKRYLERNPSGVDNGYVAVSLANVYIKQKKWNDAQETLKFIQREFAGSDEVTIAQTLERRIEALRIQFDEIAALKEALKQASESERREEIQFTLALKLLAAAELQEAESYLKPLENSSQPDRRTRARFYLGWIYKLERQYDVSAQILEVLAGESGLDENLKKGAIAELADIRFQQGDVKGALNHYRTIAAEGCDEHLSSEAAQRAWVGMAELEQSYIYFNLGDGVQAGQKIGCLVHALRVADSLGSIGSFATENKAVSAQSSAFDNLRHGRIDQAHDLFIRGLQQNPEDYRGHSGLAMVNILRSDLPEAQKEALRGYQIQPTDYSTSVMAYVLAFTNEPERAIEFYQQALEINPNYFPARFNLTCIFLRSRNYREALKHLLELEKGIGSYGGVIASKVLNNLGCALWWLGKEEDALKRFRQAMEITPGFVDAELNLKQVQLNKVPQAVTVPQILNAEK